MPLAARQVRAIAPLLVALAAACDPQAGPDYRGEPLITLRGRVSSDGPLPPLEAAMLWQRGAPPSNGDQELATRAPVEPGFPASFTVHLYQPAPAAARRSLAPGEPIWGRALAAAVPYGTSSDQLAGAGSAPAAAFPGYGIDPDHWVIDLAADARPSSITAWWLGGPQPAGFVLVRVTTLDPTCLDAAALAACVAELIQRGAPDDGTDAPGTARSFCLAPYRLAPVETTEELVLQLGADGLPAGGGTCP